MQGTWVQSLGWEDPLEEEMATHSSILAWRIQTTTIYQSVLFLAEGWYFFFQYILSFVFAENGSYDVLLLLVMNVDGS